MWQKYQHCLRININLISHLSAKAVKQNLNIAKKCEHWDLQNNKTWKTLPSTWASVKKKREEKKDIATIWCQYLIFSHCDIPSTLSTIVSLHVSYISILDSFTVLRSLSKNEKQVGKLISSDLAINIQNNYCSYRET